MYLCPTHRILGLFRSGTLTGIGGKFLSPLPVSPFLISENLFPYSFT
jgi:hypothetical protein